MSLRTKPLVYTTNSIAGKHALTFTGHDPAGQGARQDRRLATPGQRSLSGSGKPVVAKDAENGRPAARHGGVDRS